MARLKQSGPPGARAADSETMFAGARRRSGSWGAAEWASPWAWAATFVAALAAIPLFSIALAVPFGSTEALSHLAGSVLPLYVINTLALMTLTGAIAGVIGTGCAWLIVATEFPGRRVLAWALVLPLAVPAYLGAYLYSDLLEFSGPVQTGLRALTGWSARDYWFPEVRSLPGGAIILALVLYPYVYLIARAAFTAQSLSQFRAARSLGARPITAFVQIALPAARPAIIGGLALVLMEVLADFGVAEYFAIPTFSTGIFRSWLAMGDKQAAMGLAAMMLVFVIALVALEARTRQGRTESKDTIALGTPGEPLVALSSIGKMLALTACLVPVLLGFAIPALHLITLAASKRAQSSAGDLMNYILSSAWLGLATALVCCAAAIVLIFARARSTSAITKASIRLATLGYALPGALLAVGLLAPLGAFDQSVTRFARDTFGYSGSLLLSGTSVVLIYALAVRFLTVAYNALEGGLAKIPPSLDAAARSLGASPGRVLRRIYLPLLSPSLAAGLALVMIDTLRELPATLIMRPFNLETLATRTYRLASDERLIEASIPAFILLLVGLIPVLLLNRMAAR
ncbi:MAG: iron ABC transporter permease [Pseudomonadota bacterium]